MNKLKEQMPVKYKQLDNEQGSDFYFERSLDLIFSPGCFTIEIDHSGKDVGLPIEDCGEEHYFVGNLVVTDSGTAGHKQENRVTGQQLTITSRNGKETKVFTRTYADGVWSQWRSLACTGIYNNISTTDELLATVESLVTENTRAKEFEESVKRAAVDISSLACTASKENVTITGKSMDGEVAHAVKIPVATTENAGVMTVMDKIRLDNGVNSDDIPLVTRKNYYNPEDEEFLPYSVINHTGAISASTGYAVTGFIPLNNVIGSLILTQNGVVQTSSGGAINLYDKEKNRLVTEIYKDVNGVARWRDGVAYVRFSVQSFETGNIQIEQGDTFSHAISHNTTELHEDIKILRRNLAGSIISADYLDDCAVSVPKLSKEFNSSSMPNLIDINAVQKNKAVDVVNNKLWYNNNSATLCITGFIPVKPHTKYTAFGLHSYIECDKEYKPIGQKIGVGLTTEKTITTNDCSYIIANMYMYGSDKSDIRYRTLRMFEGEILYPYIPYGVKADSVYAAKGLQTVSLLGSNGLRMTAQAITANGRLSFANEGFPCYIKGCQMSFHGNFSNFVGLKIGRMLTHLNNPAYSSKYFTITSDKISLFSYKESERLLEEVQHGLSISGFIRVAISERESNLLLIVQTLNGYFEQEFDAGESNGAFTAESLGSEFTHVEMSISNNSFKKPVWMFGNSYFGADSEVRQMYWLKKWGFTGYLKESFGGQTSQYAYTDFTKCLAFGTPKYLVWAEGMNDDNNGVLDDITTGQWYEYYIKVKELCERYGIELILATVPEVRGNYFNKDAMAEVIRNSGLRYIDLAKALGSNANGEWYGNGTEYDYQSADNVHPSVYGARAMAIQFLIDFPEIMQY